MVTPIRYTPQKQQEKRSLRQISERLDEFGWLPTRPDEDLGEDLIIHLYFEGKATGVLFHLQAKSITNLHERRKDEVLPYRFAVKDLLHWEQFELPVVLMVWDVNLREGRWQLLHTAVLQLDRQNPGWREQKTATVYLPWQNRTDDEGLIELRKGIGRYLFPLLTDAKSMELKFRTEFPDTEEGREELEAFKQILEQGREGTFTSKLIWSGKLASWFGESEEVIWSFKQKRHPEAYMASLEIIGNSGETSLISTELREKSEDNLETFGFSNRHLPSTFILLDLIISRNSNENILNFEINQNASVLGNDANEAYNNLRFWHLLGKGGRLRLKTTVFGSKTLTYDAPAQDRSFMPPTELVDLVSKLRLIQIGTGNFFDVPFFDVWSDQDEFSIKKCNAIIEYGKLTAKVKEFPLIAKSIEVITLFLDTQRQGKKVESLREIYETSSVEIFGETIQTGRVTRHINGDIGMTIDQLEKAISSFAPGQQMEIKLVDVTVTEIYPDWFVNEAERLAHKLTEAFEVDDVYLFGSLAWGERFHPQTDIDLAVQGLAPDKFFKAIGYLERQTRFPFDLVDLDNVPDYLHERILTQGKLLYERELAAIRG